MGAMQLGRADRAGRGRLRTAAVTIATWCVLAALAAAAPDVGAAGSIRIARALPSTPPAAGGGRRITFSPDSDGVRDTATIVACAPATSAPRVVAFVRMRAAGYSIASVGARPMRRATTTHGACGAGSVEWRGTWDGTTPRLQAIERPGDAYWLSACATTLGFDTAPGLRRTITGNGCAADPVITHLRTTWIRRDWTRSIAGGQVAPLNVLTDARRVDAELTSSTGRVLRRWRRVRPDRLRVMAPRLDHGDLLHLTITAGSETTTAPLPVRGARPLDSPAPGTALVVAPSLTWLAYNRVDADDDGGPDSWYATGIDRPRAHVRITVPMVTDQPRYAEVDATWAMRWYRWWAATPELAGAPVQVVTDRELGELPIDALRRYAAIVLPGHTEYYTTSMYRNVLDYRAAGGDLLVLQGNAFYRRVEIDVARDRLVSTWARSGSCVCTRTLAFDDYTISGVGFTGYDYDVRRPMRRAGDDPQLAQVWDGVELPTGAIVGTYGAEFDGPPPAQHPVAASWHPLWGDPDDPGRMAGGMLLHPGGGFTFATGAMTFAATVTDIATPAEQRAALDRVLRNVHVLALAT